MSFWRLPFGFCRSPLQHIETEAVEIGINIPANRPARSNPVPMPSVVGRGVPVLIESGSASKFIMHSITIDQNNIIG